MSEIPQRFVSFERLHNFRDFGGYPAADGRMVRRNLLFRSDSLGKLAGADVRRFAALGVRTVIDLRYPWEADAGGRVPAGLGVAYHNCSIEHRPYDQAALGEVIDPVRFLADRYAEVANDGHAEIAQALRIIASDSAPVVIHCASGKDRTGLIAALVLSFLGVAEADITADFALTGLATQRLIADWHAFYPDRALLWPHYGKAPAAAMQVFLAELAQRHGSVRGYAMDYLRVPDAVISNLRTRYLDGEATAAG